MKTIETVFKHLNEEKVELKSERVELGVDDYLSYQRNLLTIREQIEQEVKKYASMKKQLLIKILPLSGTSKPAINLSAVVFPHPDGPRRHIRSPLSIVNVKFSKIFC